MSAGVRRGQKVSDGASGRDCRRRGVLSACVGDVGEELGGGVDRGRQAWPGVCRVLKRSVDIARGCLVIGMRRGCQGRRLR